VAAHHYTHHAPSCTPARLRRTCLAQYTTLRTCTHTCREATAPHLRTNHAAPTCPACWNTAPLCVRWIAQDLTLLGICAVTAPRYTTARLYHYAYLSLYTASPEHRSTPLLRCALFLRCRASSFLPAPAWVPRHHLPHLRAASRRSLPFSLSPTAWTYHRLLSRTLVLFHASYLPLSHATVLRAQRAWFCAASRAPQRPAPFAPALVLLASATSHAHIATRSAITAPPVRAADARRCLYGTPSPITHHYNIKLASALPGFSPCCRVLYSTACCLPASCNNIPPHSCLYLVFSRRRLRFAPPHCLPDCIT